MSRRRSTSAALQAMLADKDLERERIRAQRDSQNFATGVGALRSLVPAAGELYGAYEKHVGDEANQNVEAFMGENLTTTGDEAMSAEDYAAKLSKADKRFAEPEENPDGVARFLDDPLGVKKRARAAAAVKAQAGLAGQIKGNRDAVLAKTTAENAAKAKAEADAAVEARKGSEFDRTLGGRDADRDARGVEGEKDRAARIRAAEIAAAARKKTGGAGAPTEKSTLDLEKRRVDLERAKGALVRETDAPDKKKKEQVLEVENFTANINDNIDALMAQIEASGTFEALGPESAAMERAITNIATDLAKLADPGSVAREGEVSLAKKGLFPTGAKALFTRNSTAKATLQQLKTEVEKRRANAYRIRGIHPAGAPEAAVTPEVDGDTVDADSYFGGQ